MKNRSCKFENVLLILEQNTIWYNLNDVVTEFKRNTFLEKVKSIIN